MIAQRYSLDIVLGEKVIVVRNELEDRYHRQRLIEGWRQERLRDGAVFIAGIGALGCEAAKNCALMGVGKIVLADNDAVELSNLNRQMLFTDEDIGKYKASRAKTKLEMLNPSIQVEAFDCSIQRIPQKVYEECRVILGCLDNWPTRRWLNSLSVELNKVFIDGGIYGLVGCIQTVVPFRTACLECQPLVPDETLLAECTLRRRRPRDLLRDLEEQGLRVDKGVRKCVLALFKAGYKTVNDIKYAKVDELAKVLGVEKEVLELIQDSIKPRDPAILTVSAVIAAMQVQETAKYLMMDEINEPENNFIQFDGANQRLTGIQLARNSECVVCGESFRLKTAIFEAYSNDTLADLEDRLAMTFGYPDAKVQHGTKILQDSDASLKGLGMKDDDIIYVHSSRHPKPLKLKLRILH